MTPHRKLWLTTATVLAAGLSLPSCSGDGRGPVAPPPPEAVPDTVDVAPTTQTAGGVVSIPISQLEAGALADRRFTLGGETAPFALSGDTAVAVALPLFVGANGWSEPPSDPVRLEVWEGDSLVAVSREPLHVTPLPRADGSLELLAAEVDSARAALERLLLGLPVAHPRERAVREGFTAMMQAAVSAGDSSLVRILDGTSSLWGGQAPDLALVDAILASTGTLDRFRALADALRGPESPAAQLASAVDSPYCLGEPAPDLDLACLMQMTVILDNFTQYFVKPVAEAYNLTVGLGAGLAAISGVGTAVGTAASITGAVLAIEAFVMEKLVVAALPTEILAFAAVMESDTVGVGELTRTNIVLTAQNEPIPITLNDMVSVIMSSMSFVEVEAAEGFAAVLMRAALFVLDQYRGILLTYEAAHPGSFTDPELTSMPLMLYGPVFVTHPDLVKLHTLAPEILQPQDTILEWKGLQKGSGAVRAETRGAESRAKVVRDWMLLTTYTGAAFGEELVSTDNMTVVVSNQGDLAIDISGLPEGAIGNVSVSGPGGFGATATQSDTLRKLEVGEYTVRGYPVTVEGTTYGADPDEQTITVLDRETVAVSVAYSPNTSSLEVVIEGLPSALDGDVTVSGPGLSRTLIATTTLDSLAAGLYTVTVNTVTSQDGIVFPPKVASLSVDVPERGSASVTAQYKNPIRMTVYAGWQNSYPLSGSVTSLGRASATQEYTTEEDYFPASGTDEYVMGECFPVGPVLVSEDGSTTWTAYASTGAQSATGQFTVTLADDGQTLSFTFAGTADGNPPPAGADPTRAVYGGGTARAGSVRSRWQGLLILVETFGLQADMEIAWSLQNQVSSTDSENAWNWASAGGSLAMIPDVNCGLANPYQTPSQIFVTDVDPESSGSVVYQRGIWGPHLLGAELIFGVSARGRYPGTQYPSSVSSRAILNGTVTFRVKPR